MARHHRGRGRRGGRQANPRGSGGSGRDEANWSGAEAGNHNGHNYDDHSRVGQSQPADQSQAAPPLAEEPAALPRKESFEAIGIHVRRAEPVFPPGPGYGAAGTPCVGRANRFLGRPVDEGLHQYNVSALIHSSLLALI
jgi:eukaryotic translation initiation factor 2C